MHDTQDSLYWAMLYMLISLRKYELLHYSEEEQEAWLESIGPGPRTVIRLKRHDADWSRWVRADMAGMYPVVKQIRKQGIARGAKLYNVYVSQWEPVDDWEETAAEMDESMSVTTLFLTEEGSCQRRFFCEVLQLDEKEQQTLSALQEEEPEVLRYRLAHTLKNQQKKREDVLNYARPIVTKCLIALQLVMFGLLEWFGGSQSLDTLIKFGAKSNALILQGEWWRFFTPIVLHIGLLHLLMNTFALYYIGSQLERVIGNVRFLLIYLFAGFSGGVLSFVFSDSVSAGASGAIFGCFAALLYVVRAHSAIFPRSVIQSVITLIAINLLFGFVVPGIDNAGHIGGLIGGFLAAAVLHVPKQKGKPLRRLAALALAIVAAAGMLWYGFQVQGSNPQMLLTAARTSLQENRTSQAEALLERAVGQRNAPVDAHYLLGYVYGLQGKTQAAKKELDLVVSRKPDHDQAHYLLGLLYWDERDLANAREHISKAMRLQPGTAAYEKLHQAIQRD